MKSINISKLYLDTPAEHDYYSKKGDILIPKGTIITERHISYMLRRDHFELYIQDDDEPVQKSRIRPEELMVYDKAISLPNPENILKELGPLEEGKKGFVTLTQSKLALKFDRILRKGGTLDRPFGQPLISRMTKKMVWERNDVYKKSVIALYRDALSQVKILLTDILRNKRVNGQDIRAIVERFVEAFTFDKDILLDLSLSKPDHENYLFHHALNVCLLSINTAVSSGFSEGQVIDIGMGALLHDLGMLMVPEHILYKKGRLGDTEWYEVQKHPILGLHLLSKMKYIPESASFIIYQVHERENGKGYPKMRTSRFIHQYAKIVQIADIFEALTSPRTYREALVPFNSTERMIKMSKQGFISGEFLTAFLKNVSLFPVGSLVQLDNGKIARVIGSNPETLARPLLTILTDIQGKLLNKEDYRQEDLLFNSKLSIVKALPLDYLDIPLMEGF